jgi:DNA-binding response OmpR family regulator
VKKRVLLVDDSATTLMMEKLILRQEDFDLVTASNGEEAIEKALKESPDLILLDVVMPRKNGFEVCRALRQTPGLASVPIILVTTRSEEESLETGYLSGCTDFVMKPIDGVELLTKVRCYLAASAPDGRLREVS